MWRRGATGVVDVHSGEDVARTIADSEAISARREKREVVRKMAVPGYEGTALFSGSP